MPRFHQNTFVSGEISPALFGRTDMQAYYQSAAKIENFVVERTGGVRKRSGTQLLFDYSPTTGTMEAVKTVPFIFDRTHAGLLLLYKKVSNSRLFYRFFKVVNGEYVGRSEEYSSDLITITDDKFLDTIKYNQLGDTIYFTKRGMKTFTIMVYYATMVLEYSMVENSIQVANTPSLEYKTKGFAREEYSSDQEAIDNGYRKSSRTYRLIGFKGTVMSKETDLDVPIWLAWKAGAYVELSFTPNWANHDYYVLAKLQGTDFGVLKSFYPDMNKGTKDTQTYTNTGITQSYTFNGTTYTATNSLHQAWAIDPNELNTDGSHKAAAFISGRLEVTATNKTSPILSLTIYPGARITSGSEVVAVGNPLLTKVKLLKKENNADILIAEWVEQNLSYGDSPITLVVANPATAPNNGKYYIEFENENNTAVPLRGIFLNQDTTKCMFKDDNIAPSVIQGLQDKITVGDTGMDCDSMTVFQQRIIYASSQNMPFSMWFSRIGDLKSFYADRPLTPDSAFSITIPPISSAKILHMISDKVIFLFTEGGEYIINVGDNGLTYQTVNVKKTSSVGAAETVQPVATEQWIMFVAQDLRSVYEVAYQLQSDNHVPIERSAFSMHMTENARIKKFIYQRYPSSVLWFLLTDGTMLGLTYMPEQQVYAWHRHSFAGDDLELVDINTCSSITDISGCDATSDVFLTWRKNGDNSRVWIERMRAFSCSDTPEVGQAKCADHCGYTEEQYPNGTDPQRNINAQIITVRPENPQVSSMGLNQGKLNTIVRVRRAGEISVRPLEGNQPPMVRGTIKQVQEDGRVRLNNADLFVLPRTFITTDGKMVIASTDKWPCEILSVMFNTEIGDYGQP